MFWLQKIFEFEKSEIIKKTNQCKPSVKHIKPSGLLEKLQENYMQRDYQKVLRFINHITHVAAINSFFHKVFLDD